MKHAIHDQKRHLKNRQSPVKRENRDLSPAIVSILPDLMPPGWPGHVISWILAAAAGASLLGAWRLWGVPAQPLSNVPLPASGGVAQYIAIGAICGLGVAALWWVWGGKALGLAPRFRRLAIQWTALPILASWAPLFGVGPENRIWTILAMACLAGVGGALGGLALRGGTPRPLSPRAANWILLLFIFLVGTSYACAAILGFRGLFNGSYTDFGGFHNAAWNTLHGRFMWCDHWKGSILGEHLSLYLVFPMLTLLLDERAEIFLLWQALIMAAAAWPIYLTARRETARVGFALVLGLAYLLSPFVGRSVMFEFHDLFFAAFLMAWLLWACHKDVSGKVFLSLGLLTLMVREDMALPVLAVGLYEIFCLRRRRGMILIGMAILWGVLCINLFMPSAAAGHWVWKPGGSGHLDRYSHLGAGYGEIVKTLLGHPIRSLGLLFSPEKSCNYLLFLIPLAFLPLLCPKRLWLALPVFLLHGLSNWSFQNQFDVHYSPPILPVFYFAAIGGAVNLAGWLARNAGKKASRNKPQGPMPQELKPEPNWSWRMMTGSLIAAALIAHLFTARWRPGIPAPLTPYDGRWHMTLAALPWRPAMWPRDEHLALFQELRQNLPRRASIATLDPCVPHFTARPLVRAFRRLGDRFGDIDLVLISPRVSAYTSARAYMDQLVTLLKDPDWDTAWVRQDWILLARHGKLDKATSSSLQRLAARYSDTPLGHQLLGEAAARAGRTEWARREAQIVAGLEPHDIGKQEN